MIKFKFDQIYRPEWETIYSYAIEIPSILSLIMYPFVLYTVVFKSPNSMAKYKWILANSITWSFLLEFMFTVFKPYLMLPLYLGFPAGFFKTSGSTAAYAQVEIYIFILSADCASLSLCAFYRYSKALPQNEGYLLSKNWHILVTMICCILLLIFPISFTLPMNRLPVVYLKEKLKNETVDMDPNFFAKVSLIGYDYSLTAPWSYICACWMVASTTIFFIVSIIVMINLRLILKKNTPRWSAQTLKLQWVLFNTFFLSIINAIIFLIFPMLLELGVIFLVQDYVAPIGNMLFVIASFHAIADYLILMYFILPYRRFCTSCFRKIFSLFLCRKQAIQTQVNIISD